MKKIKTKVIDCNVLLQNPNRLMRFVFRSNSLESTILDLQELYPNERINRESILTWKFVTVAEYEKIQQEINEAKSPNSNVTHS